METLKSVLDFANVDEVAFLKYFFEKVLNLI